MRLPKLLIGLAALTTVACNPSDPNLHPRSEIGDACNPSDPNLHPRSEIGDARSLPRPTRASYHKSRDAQPVSLPLPSSPAPLVTSIPNSSEALDLGRMHGYLESFTNGAQQEWAAQTYANYHQYANLFEEAAGYGTPLELLVALAAVESRFNPKAKSSKGARGITQILPETAREWGLDPKKLDEPAYVLPITSAKLTEYSQTFRLPDGSSSWERALAAWNCGERRTRDAQEGKPLPQETIRFIPKVFAFQQYFNQRSQAPGTARTASRSLPEEFTYVGMRDTNIPINGRVPADVLHTEFTYAFRIQSGDTPQRVAERFDAAVLPLDPQGRRTTTGNAFAARSLDADFNASGQLAPGSTARIVAALPQYRTGQLQREPL